MVSTGGFRMCNTSVVGSVIYRIIAFSSGESSFLKKIVYKLHIILEGTFSSNKCDTCVHKYGNLFLNAV